MVISLWRLERNALAGSSTLDRAAATRIAGALERLRLSHPQRVVTSCPADDASITVIVLSYTGQPDVALWYRRAGCQWVSNGAIGTRAGDLGDTVNSL